MRWIKYQIYPVPSDKQLFPPDSLLRCQIQSWVYQLYACGYLYQRAAIHNEISRIRMDTLHPGTMNELPSLPDAGNRQPAGGATASVHGPFLAVESSAMNQQGGTAGAKGIVSCRTQHITGIDMAQTLGLADCTGFFQGGRRGGRTIGELVGRVKATDMPGHIH
jgi:hypothetical protein